MSPGEEAAAWIADRLQERVRALRRAGEVIGPDHGPREDGAGAIMERIGHQARAADRVTVSFDQYRRRQREGEAAVIICPGFCQSKETPTFQRLSRAVAEAGCDVLAMDFRGHGRSSGRYTFSAREEADLLAVLAWARERYRRLGVLGFSLGAAIAINTASRSPEQMYGLVAVSAPSRFEEIEFKFWTPEAWRVGVWSWEPGVGCRPGNVWLPKAPPVERIRELSALPLLLLHGTRDVIVSADHSRRLYAAAPEPKRLELIEGGSHAEALFRDDPEGFLRRVRPWLTATVAAS
jgi:pimeloyl-ACP methyl ester carboxylesterase